MKKLGKLSINLNKVMKNEELVNLKGGEYYNNCCTLCDVTDYNGITKTYGFPCNFTEDLVEANYEWVFCVSNCRLNYNCFQY